jgi:hypothetical protein
MLFGNKIRPFLLCRGYGSNELSCRAAMNTDVVCQGNLKIFINE